MGDLLFYQVINEFGFIVVRPTKLDLELAIEWIVKIVD